VCRLAGKTTFFVANQANIESISPDELGALETEFKSIDEENKLLAADVKALSNGECVYCCTKCPTKPARLAELSKLKASPTDVELSAQIALTTNAVTYSHILPLTYTHRMLDRRNH
jgi:26S proteasome regulatory subunit, ATPase 3, interacting protein